VSGLSDQRLEAALREMLEERRPGAATGELQDRVARVPMIASDERRSRWFRPAVSFAATIAALGVTAAIAAFVVSGPMLRPPMANVGASPVPPAAIDPLIDGPGIIAPPDASTLSVPQALIVVPWALAAVAIVLVLRRVDLRRRLGRVAAIALVGAICVPAYGVSAHPGFAFGYQWGPLMGVAVPPLREREIDGETWIVTAGAGEPFGIVVDVANPGLLPIRLEGVIDEPDPLGIDERWTGLRIHVDPDGGMPGLQATLPYRHIDVPPEGHVLLYVTGRAGRCALGTAFDGSAEQYTDRSSLRIAYSVLGLSTSAEVDLPFLLAQPLRPGCVSGPVP
jgi:hypothetical protein